MARITGPSELSIPSVLVNDVPVLVPIDLPEGGRLEVTIGESPLVPPQIGLDIPRGCAVVMLAPDVVDKHAPGLRTEAALKGAPAVALKSAQIHGLPLLSPVWVPLGGFMQVRVGPDPKAMPQPSTPIAKGALLAVLPPEPAEIFRQGFVQAGVAQNPYAVVPNGVHP